ncbi:Uma2 family endonuclease [Myxacorys almedinensis]|uniref:Uma2 family endonuclease n=1 Tax=Myxacorys almedinensis A TaxID=2690445 RepID=A0A8J7Z3T0_9CYAN|nr:Uma2 family endonuclease [Myxacorys almedinensis]NDJ19469.1 Uma2 family endonuclease [Myxacorys almedinensis A]
MTLTTAKWTLNDYHQMIDAGILNDRRVELLNGEIIEMSPEGTPHAYYGNRSSKYLQRLLGERADVREGHPITLPNDSEPQPDIAIVQPLDAVYLEHHPYPENIFWIIEYSYSTIAIDLEPKRRIYASAGIREYWVVNLKTKTLIVFRDPTDGDYGWRFEFGDGTISPISFPDVVVEIARLMN